MATYHHLDLQKLLTPSCLPQSLVYAWLWSERKDKCGNGEEIQTESNCKFLWYQKRIGCIVNVSDLIVCRDVLGRASGCLRWPNKRNNDPKGTPRAFLFIWRD